MTHSPFLPHFQATHQAYLHLCAQLNEIISSDVNKCPASDVFVHLDCWQVKRDKNKVKPLQNTGFHPDNKRAFSHYKRSITYLQNEHFEF